MKAVLTGVLGLLVVAGMLLAGLWYLCQDAMRDDDQDPPSR